MKEEKEKMVYGEQIKVGDYQTKHFDMCPGATALYKDMEPNAMVMKSVRLQDSLFGLEKRVLESKKASKADLDKAMDLASQIMDVAKEMGKTKEHNYIQGHVDKIKEVMMKEAGYGMKKDEEMAGYGMKKKEAMSHGKKDEMEAGYGMKKKKASVDEFEYIMMETEVTDVIANICASTGKTILRISGIAFHEGMNKNRWEITKAGAESLLEKMIGADLTLNHPPTKEKGVGFVRNMDGGVNDAVVGIVKEATLVETESGYNVNYVAEVHRPELFQALESGLWSRKNYGVSIGGWGKPVAIAEDGKMTFGEDFTFDHLAIVHKPAYPKASIEKVEKISPQKASDDGDALIYPSENRDLQGEPDMTDEIDRLAQELEDLKSELIIANATINEHEAQKAAIAEEARLALVTKASEIGLKGHEDLQIETLENLIASWEATRPEPQEVVLAEATPASDVSVEENIQASEEPTRVVANYHNGRMIESDADVYGRVWNAFAKAYNSNYGSASDKAYTFDEAVEKGLININ